MLSSVVNSQGIFDDFYGITKSITEGHTDFRKTYRECTREEIAKAYLYQVKESGLAQVEKKT